MINKHLRVVLAEDSVVLRDGMVELLGARGCDVVATAGRLTVSERAVEKHVAAVFTEFGLHATDTDNRRVKAVLTYLAESGS